MRSAALLTTGLLRETLRLAVAHFAPVIAERGARIALFQAWPPAARPDQFRGTIESFALAAQDAGGTLLPVAEAWERTLGEMPAARLYADGLHADADGGYLAALVLWARLFERTPVGLPPAVRTRGGSTIAVDPLLAAGLQQIAADVALRRPPPLTLTAPPVITSRC